MSIDAEGYVVLTTIVKIVIVYKVTKTIIIDPFISYHHIFQSMSCRFSSNVYEKGIFDATPLIAIGSKNSVLIIEGS